MPEDTLTTAQNVLEQTKAEGLTPFAGSDFDTGKPISRPSNIESPYFTATPAETPIAIPESTAPSVAGDLGAMQERVRQAGEQAVSSEELAQSREARDETLNLLADALGGQGIEGLTARAEEGFGLPEADRELRDINNQILQRQVALNREIESIQTEAGTTASFKDAQVRSAQRTAAREMADLSVIQMAKQGRYDSAKAQADRAVAIQMEEKKSRLDILSLIYQENKDIFTKQEQRQFEARQAERERLLDREEENLKDIKNLAISALESGAPASIVERMMSTESITDAMSIGGAYVGLNDRQRVQAQLTGQYLENRIKLIELAEKGDTQAINDLGYDPNNLPRTTKQIIANEEEYKKLSTDVSRIDQLLTNNTGLELSSGAIRSPLASSVVTGLVSYPFIKTRQEDFLTGASYVIDNLTFDKLIALKEEGATFGALSDNELRSIGNAASELAAMAVRKDGQLEGFRGSEDKLREQLRIVQEGLKKAQDQLNAELGLDQSELREISEL